MDRMETGNEEDQEVIEKSESKRNRRPTNIGLSRRLNCRGEETETGTGARENLMVVVVNEPRLLRLTGVEVGQ